MIDTNDTKDTTETTPTIRIRFHGRGGHGVKTASRIVGTAAFLSGLQVQDSPIYGAERRGASVTAYTRMGSEPILERGVIEFPDLIVIGDETLLADSTANVLAGQQSASAVFVNAARDASITAKYQIAPPTQALDVTQRALSLLGTASALSAGLAGAAAGMTGIITRNALVEAVEEELRDLDIDRKVVAQNMRLAEDVFVSTTPVDLRPREDNKETDVGDSAVRGTMHHVGYDDPIRGSAVILAAGNATARRTGSWRLERPEVDRENCIRCDICFVRCPDGAIALDQEGYPVFDYDHCKGCMICLEECPTHAITGTREVRAW